MSSPVPPRFTPSSTRVTPPSAGRFFATFAYAWFTIGLFTGTLVLVLVVRAVIDVIQKFGWGETAQNRILIGLILLFIVTSFMLARWVVRVAYRKPPRARRMILAALAIPAAGAMYAWSDPTKFLVGFSGTTRGTITMSNGGPTFYFGSYPDYPTLDSLKKHGVEHIVSLQDPRVLVELQGITEERKSAAALGMDFIQAPMLPWVSDNSASIEQLKQIALHGKGTYYIHCGLGRDRTNIAKRVLESIEPQAHAHLAASKGLQSALSFEDRVEPFQRGRLIQLAPEAWLIPQPNDPEFYGFIIQGRPGHVFLVLDPADTLQARLMAKAIKDMRQYAVSFSVIPTSAADTLRRAIKPADTTAAALDAIIRKLKAQTPPFTVIVPYTTYAKSAPTQPLIRAILKAYGVSGAAQPVKPAAAAAKTVAPASRS